MVQYNDDHTSKCESKYEPKFEFEYAKLRGISTETVLKIYDK